MKTRKKTLSTIIIIMATMIATCLVIPFMVQSTEPTYMHMTDLHRGWNLISLPRPGLFSKYSLMIEYNESEFIWRNATDNALILTFLYGYDRELQSYVVTDGIRGGEGYWIYALENCTLYYPQYNPPPPPS